MKRLALTIAALAVTLAGSAAQAAPTSGMLLGIYAFPNWQGLRVTGTIPGYSANGRLFRDDVLVRVAADDGRVFETQTRWQLEYAKDQIGPYRPAALEVNRPGIGMIYLWVEFQPIGGAAQQYQHDQFSPSAAASSTRSFAADSAPAAAPRKMEAKIFTEQERPGARALFNGGARPQASSQPAPQATAEPAASVAPQPPTRVNRLPGNAASLFGR